VSGPSAPVSSATPESTPPLDSDALTELVSAHADLYGVGVALVSPVGERLAAAGPGVDAPALGHHHIHPLYYDGARIFDIVLGPCLRRPDRPQADAACSAELAAAIPELGQAELERLGHHLERLILLLLRQQARRTAAAAPGHGPSSTIPPPLDLDPAAILGEVERAKSTLLSTVSHEMRTPLTSVIGYAEMLLEGMAGPVNDEQREYLSTILGKADHLLRLITGMLDLARLEASPPTVDRRPVSIVEVIERAAASLTSEADRRAIALTLPSRQLPRVLADSRKIRQVLMHLIANAIKFTPRGGDVVVAAEVGSLSPSDLLSAPLSPPPSIDPEELARRFGVRVSVRDTGIGISPMAQARIFEPFFQVDQSTTREYGGTGLGLSLAKSYVEAHGGSIWVHSQPSRGSTFTLSLPAVPEDLHDYLTRGDSDEPTV
jgi:two-component system, NarL family, sensor histidine kinase BarA